MAVAPHLQDLGRGVRLRPPIPHRMYHPEEEAQVIEFKPWPKISRIDKPVVVTEKIDGTNAQVTIIDLAEHSWQVEEINRYIDLTPELELPPIPITAQIGALAILAGSRKRWITPEDDNFGFARWVEQNATDLVHLGPGTHYGEWWGKGIQRGYDLDHKRFSLFNTDKWSEVRPACCDVVPVLYKGSLDTDLLLDVQSHLWFSGSAAAPGFKPPEGVMVYLTGPGVYLKAPFEAGPKKQG